MGWIRLSVIGVALAASMQQAQATIPPWVAPGLQLEYEGLSEGTIAKTAVVILLKASITGNSGGIASGVDLYFIDVNGSFLPAETGPENFQCNAGGACTSTPTPGFGVPLWIDPTSPATAVASITGSNGEVYNYVGITSFKDVANGKTYQAGLLVYQNPGSGVTLQAYYDPQTGLLLGLFSTYPDEIAQLYFDQVLAGNVTPVNTNPGDTIDNAVSLVSAVLPTSRSAQVGVPITAFATIINGGTDPGTGCGLSLGSNIPATFAFQTTNPATNAVTGAANTPANIAANSSQSFVFSLTPTTAFSPTNVTIGAGCGNSNPAPTENGINTILLSASTSAVPDIIALVATAKGDGVLHLPNGAGAFAVATDNVGGASGTIIAAVNTGGTTLPLALAICQTNPTTGQCLAPPTAGATTTIAPGATPTFAIFGTPSAVIPLDALNNRVYVTFTDSGGVVRGSTSVAVETQ
jgi:hypothetical protein